jgi:hypothetical protein
MKKIKSDLSVLVSSCDKYSHLLPYFTFLFDKYWGPKKEYKKYISTESIVLEHPDYSPILTNISSWSDSIIESISNIQTKYVFIILEDFFLVREISKDTIEKSLKIIRKENVDKYVYHYPHVAFEGKLDQTQYSSNVYKIQQDSEYTLSLQPSIWKVDFLKKCLIKGESPWDFEIKGSDRINKMIQHKIYMELIPYGYHREAMSRGEFTPEYYKILEIEGLL